MKSVRFPSSPLHWPAFAALALASLGCSSEDPVPEATGGATSGGASIGGSSTTTGGKAAQTGGGPSGGTATTGGQSAQGGNAMPTGGGPAAGQAGAGGGGTSSGGDAGMAGTTAGAGGGGGSGGGIVGAMALYDFEVDDEGWELDGMPAGVSLQQSMTQKFAGAASLEMVIVPAGAGAGGGGAGGGGAGGGGAGGGGAGGGGAGGVATSAQVAGGGAGGAGGGGTAGGGAGGATAGGGAGGGGAGGEATAGGGAGGAPTSMTYYARVLDPPLSPEQTVTMHVWVPDDPGVIWVNAVIQYDADWSGWYEQPMTLVRGMWTTFEFPIPVSTVPPIKALTVQFGVSPTFGGSVYIDEVGW